MGAAEEERRKGKEGRAPCQALNGPFLLLPPRAAAPGMHSRHSHATNVSAPPHSEFMYEEGVCGKDSLLLLLHGGGSRRVLCTLSSLPHFRSSSSSFDHLPDKRETTMLC